MAEIEENPKVDPANPQTQTILKRELDAYILQKFTDAKCPTCGDGTFTTVVQPKVAPEQSDEETPVAQLSLFAGFGSFVPAVGTICSYCGHINLTYWNYVYDWVSSQKKETLNEW